MQSSLIRSATAALKTISKDSWKKLAVKGTIALIGIFGADHLYLRSLVTDLRSQMASDQRMQQYLIEELKGCRPGLPSTSTAQRKYWESRLSGQASPTRSGPVFPLFLPQPQSCGVPSISRAPDSRLSQLPR